MRTPFSAVPSFVNNETQRLPGVTLDTGTLGMGGERCNGDKPTFLGPANVVHPKRDKVTDGQCGLGGVSSKVMCGMVACERLWVDSGCAGCNSDDRCVAASPTNQNVAGSTCKQPATRTRLLWVPLRLSEKNIWVALNPLIDGCGASSLG